MTKPIFYEGQEVGCLIFGEGIIKNVDSLYAYVDFDGYLRNYQHNGAYYNDYRPTLYPIEQYRAIIANLPAPEPEKWHPKPGEWCWFNDGGKVAYLDRFKFYNMNTPYQYKTMSGNCYSNCAPFTGELPEHLKEVQP